MPKAYRRAGQAIAWRSHASPAMRIVGASALLLVASSAFCGARAADCGAMPYASIDWQGCNKSSLLLPGSALDGANLAGANLSFTDLRGSSMNGANFEKAALFRSSLADSKAEKAHFSKIEAYRASFKSVVAPGASFANAELQRVDFSGADLTGADFSKAELGRANLDGATLTGAKFKLANLSRSNLNKAKFEGAIDLSGAFMLITRIEGMDMSAVTGLTQAQVDMACGDGDTKLPGDLKPPSTWPCKHSDDDTVGNGP